MNVVEPLLALVRLGIGHHAIFPYQNVDWNAIQSLAQQQGLMAVVLDGVNCLEEKHRPPKELLLQWIGEVLQGYECRYESYKKTVADLAGFYNKYGFKMMVLKGYVCSLYWPRPEHRPCGDIDIWQFGKQKEADVTVYKEKGIKIDKSHHLHTIFCWQGFTVENHYDFLNVYSSKSNRDLNTLLKQLGLDDSHWVNVEGEKIYVPSSNLHALFLIKHMASHFASSGITLRQVLDWAFFSASHIRKIDWAWLEGILDQYGMKSFYNCINAICFEDLGFKMGNFSSLQYSPVLKERILNDMLFPEYSILVVDGIISRLRLKIQRWRGNKWKRDLCYSDGCIYSFIAGVWSHLLRPKTI